MGPLFCLLSAVGFGLMAVFAKLAYGEGVDVDALLVVRFGLAGLVLTSIALANRSLLTLPRRSVLTGLAMGGVGYAVQAGLYLAAVSRVDASQVALVFCVYPVLVTAGAIAIGRERASVRRILALGLALGGIVFVLGGAGGGGFDPVGALLSLGSALVYTCYILVGDRVVSDVPALPLAALICVGATVSCTLASLVVSGGPDLGITAAGWGWLAAIALVSTVGAILLFFTGLAHVGPSVAALLSSIEPVVTVAAAALVFGEGLTVAQAGGGVLVLVAVAVVQWPTRRPSAEPALEPVVPVAAA